MLPRPPLAQTLGKHSRVCIYSCFYKCHSVRANSFRNMFLLIRKVNRLLIGRNGYFSLWYQRHQKIQFFCQTNLSSCLPFRLRWLQTAEQAFSPKSLLTWLQSLLCPPSLSLSHSFTISFPAVVKGSSLVLCLQLILHVVANVVLSKHKLGLTWLLVPSQTSQTSAMASIVKTDWRADSI